MRIPFFRYSHIFEQDQQELTAAFFRIAEAGAFILQEDVQLFEEELAAFCGVSAAIGVGNATDGLELILEAVGVGSGDQIILPSHTFVASAAAIVRVGAEPVFAEIGSDHLLDPVDVANRIGRRTRGIMPTQLNGRTAEMDEFRRIAQEHDLLLLEDSAQGLGSRYKGRMAGGFGIAGVYSFYPAKTLGAMGDGGAIVTNDVEFAEQLRLMRDHGRGHHGGGVRRWGRNSRLDNMQAAFLRVKLRHIEREIETRRQLAGLYHRGLAGIEEIRRPPYCDSPTRVDVYQNYEVEAEERDALRDHLFTRGVSTILQWGGLGVHQFPRLGVDASLPRTEAILSRSMLLPMNTSLTEDEIDYVIGCVIEFYRGGA